MIKSPFKTNRKKYRILNSHSDSELTVNRKSCSCGQIPKELKFNQLPDIGDSRKTVKTKQFNCKPLRIKDEVKIDLRKVDNVSPISSNYSILGIYPIEELSENESITKRSNKDRIMQDQTDQINRILELSKKSAKFRPIRNAINNSQQDKAFISFMSMKQQSFDTVNDIKDKCDASSQTGSSTSSNGVIEFHRNLNKSNNSYSSSSFNSFNNNISNYTQESVSIASRSCLSFRNLFSCAFLQKSTFRKYHNK
ncbi:unnamed protein product [Diamesa serratosioi]